MKFLLILVLATALFIPIISNSAFAQQENKNPNNDNAIQNSIKVQVDQNTKSIDSFFDIFTEISELFDVDSFFDVFVDLKSTDEDLQEQLDAIELTPGPAGSNGTNCWDLNENNSADFPDEDINGDNSVNVEDCRGSDGMSGTSCTVTQNDDGATISCEDGTSAVIQNGQSGTSTDVSSLESKIDFLEQYLGVDRTVRTGTGGTLDPIIIDASASIIWSPVYVAEDSGSECVNWSGGIFDQRTCTAWHYWTSGHVEWNESRSGEITTVTNSPQALWVDNLDAFDLTVSGNEERDVLLAMLLSDDSTISLVQGTQTITPSSSGESKVSFDGPDMIFENIQANIDAPQPPESSAGCSGSTSCTVTLPSPVTYTDTKTVTIQIEVTP